MSLSYADILNKRKERILSIKELTGAHAKNVNVIKPEGVNVSR